MEKYFQIVTSTIRNMMKLITTILLIFTSCVAFGQQITEIAIIPDKPDKVIINAKEEQAYELPDVLPEYPGGINGIMSFLSANLVYPPNAAEQSIQGRVLVQFVVDTKGNVSNVEIREGVDPSLDAEALRVVKLLNGWTPGKMKGKPVNVWYTLPISFKLQDETPQIEEEWDAVPIDSVGYQEMMDLGLKAQSENNFPHATAYFKAAFHINPYSIDPLERIIKMNNANQKSADNYAIYEFGVDELSRWNRLNGTGMSAIFPMEWLAEQMQSLDAEDQYPQFALMWTYLQAPSAKMRTKANVLLDKLIPICKEKQMWDQYGHMMSLKTFFLTTEDDIISLFEPNAEYLAKSPQGSGALVILSRVYAESKGDSVKAAKYMKMAEDADPERVELPKWLE